MTSQARLLRRSKESKIRCVGGRRPPANSSPVTPPLNCSVRCRLSSFISAGVMLESERPANSAGRSKGIPVSLSLLYAPWRSGSPHAVRGGVHLCVTPGNASGTARAWRSRQRTVDSASDLRVSGRGGWRKLPVPRSVR